MAKKNLLLMVAAAGAALYLLNKNKKEEAQPLPEKPATPPVVNSPVVRFKDSRSVLFNPVNNALNNVTAPRTLITRPKQINIRATPTRSQMKSSVEGVIY